jgi:hypothetical protein
LLAIVYLTALELRPWDLQIPIASRSLETSCDQM